MKIEELKNKIAFQLGFLLYSRKSIESTVEQIKEIAVDYANDSKWIKIETDFDYPEPNIEVLIVCDYTEYGRGKKIQQASTHLAETPRPFGGPNALTGSGMLKGIYFAIPAILNPKTVTHWMPIPKLP
jgi:hypothetical protein